MCILPGLKGSVLTATKSICHSRRQIWPPNFATFLATPELLVETPYADVRATAIIYKHPVFKYKPTCYYKLVRALQTINKISAKNIYPLAYDWRNTPAGCWTRDVRDALFKIIEKYSNTRIFIVAHSYGCLVCKYGLEADGSSLADSLRRTNNQLHVISCANPGNGLSASVDTLLYKRLASNYFSRWLWRRPSRIVRLKELDCLKYLDSYSEGRPAFRIAITDSTPSCFVCADVDIDVNVNGRQCSDGVVKGKCVLFRPKRRQTGSACGNEDVVYGHSWLVLRAVPCVIRQLVSSDTLVLDPPRNDRLVYVGTCWYADIDHGHIKNNTETIRKKVSFILSRID